MKTLKHLKIYLFGSLMMVLFLVTLAVDASVRFNFCPGKRLNLKFE
jgi:hypothetical protein